jgi:hypothetical protein
MALIGCVAAVAALLIGLSGARGGASCTDEVKTNAQGIRTQFCGPGKAAATIHGKAYRFLGGNCVVRNDHGVRVFEAKIGWRLDSFAGDPTGHSVTVTVKPYSTPRRYSTDNKASVRIELGTAAWASAPALREWKTLGYYRGSGTLVIKPGASGGTFSAPVPDGATASTKARRLPTVRVSGSFSCR